MPDDNLRRALDEVETDLRSSQAELSRLHRRVTFLQQSRSGLRGLLGLQDDDISANGEISANVEEPTAASDLTVEVVPDDHRPESIEAVRLILADHPGDDVHIDTIRNEMKKRGWENPSWANPDAAIYAALKRLETRDEEVEQAGRRYWRLRPNTKTSSVTSEDLFNDTSEDRS